MAANIKEKLTVGLDKKRADYYERVWRIENFEEIMKSEEQINNQRFEIVTKVAPNVVCTWVIGLEAGFCVKASRAVYLECTLCEVKGEMTSPVQATFQSEILSPNNELPTLSIVTDGQFKVNTRVHQHRLTFADITKANYIFPDGSLALKLKLAFDGQAYTGNETAPRTANPFNLTIDECTGIQTSRKAANVKHLATRSRLAMRDNMEKLLCEGESSDVKIFTSDGMELHGHKLILQMQNPVFAADFAAAKSGIVKVEDVSGKTMKIILRYLYTGDLLPSWEDADIIVEFVYAAGKYQLTDVLKLLDDTLGDDMSEEYNSCILPLLKLASKLSLKKAESSLLKQFLQQAAKTDTAEGLFSMVGTPSNKIPDSALGQAGRKGRKTLDGE